MDTGKASQEGKLALKFKWDMTSTANCAFQQED